MSLTSPALAGGFFTTSATWEARKAIILQFKKTKSEVCQEGQTLVVKAMGSKEVLPENCPETSRSARLWSLLGRHVLWSSTRKGRAQLAPKGSEGLGISTCILLNSSLKLN